ncbi:HAD family hydrolase [Gallibacterium salpingitidis]|uniref:HAD family hydrolase n=1 Tax=Gallibacterium salpingitidis TaxID=505341 RepID=A0A1A7Q593_9PAST|nr:Cof-type HAD-IIB family hydrolase [Gallibacterium salpingitidis]OBW96224.1 HAD family hydrolase [Gallibacterium salpingitidis]OBX08590.1 HAD family hydrolase [Gallibacterium salpingitidis]OBX08988.1 HAD family hydrolase [Gallibacterium salpingitidis]WKS98841.1 Cof-type HAD-IIB family hydrolase [Gallibacterium salpingitidis]
MLKYKLLATDMDGTLLDKQKTISERNQQAIHAAKQAGVKIVLASGRPLEGLQPYLQQLDLLGDDDYVLCFNGALVQRSDGKIITRQEMTGKDCKTLVAYAEKFGVFSHAFSESRGLIAPHQNSYSQHDADINRITLNIIDFSILADDEPVIKTMWVDQPEKLDQALAQLPEHIAKQYTVVRSTPFFLEFLPPEANKGSGIEKLAQHLNINADEVICIGDAGNDLHMIEYAGLGVAMGNATDEVKVIANYITADNLNSGVAEVIEKFILEQ